MIQLQEHRLPRRFSLFNLGFRPFFLGGALVSAVLMTVWILMYSNGLQPNYYSYGIYWHAHEMIYGFALAIIAGFLLTAVRNWTNVQTLYSWPLAALFLLWLFARVSPLIPNLPASLMATIDLAFAPLLAISIAWPIICSGNYRNLVFVPLLTGFFIGNLLIHLQLLGVLEATADLGIRLGLFIVVVVITIIGGRVIPFFSERGVPGGVSCRKFALIEKSIIPLSLVWLILNFVELNTLLAIVSFALAAANGLRTAGWFSLKIFSTPLVWILQLGYSFIPLGYLLFGLSTLEIVSQSIAYHAFAAGGIGALTLGMMARVSLGHTGRPLAIGPVVICAFVLMLLAAILRICIGFLPIPYLATLHLSGSLWVFAWLLFLLHYTSILIKPRLDGLYG